MEISGKIIQTFPVQTGEGKNGTWKKQQFVIETGDQYPKKICFVLWGDKVDSADLQENTNVNVSFDVESREFQGKWYTDLKAWKVDTKGASAPSPGRSQPLVQEGAPPIASTDAFTPSDDLPF